MRVLCLLVVFCPLLSVSHAAESHAYYLPHFTHVNNDWETRLSLNNINTTAVQVRLRAWSNEGESLGNATVTLNPDTSVDTSITDLFGPLSDQKGWLSVDTNGEIRGIMQFKYIPTGGTSSLTLVEETSLELVLPLLENEGTTSSGFAIANTTSDSAQVTLTISSLDGSYKKEQTVNLAARAKLVTMATSLFGDDIPEKASLRIKSDQGLTGFALTFRNSVNQIVAVPASFIPRQTQEKAALDTFIQTEMANGNIPGLGAAVIVDGQVVWSKGYGFQNIDNKRLVSSQTPFLLASISKVVTATALMHAKEGQAINLDDDVNQILSFNIDNDGGGPISTRQLLAHTSGIVDNWDQLENLYTYGSDSPITLADFVEGYLSQGGAYYDVENFSLDAPGQQWEYSNQGIALAGHLVGASTGTSLDDYCDTHIFEKLNMKQTGWHLADFQPENVATPYKLQNNGNYQALEHYGFPDWPNGQLRSSAYDVARFVAAIMNDGTLDDVAFLNAETVSEMLTSQRETGNEVGEKMALGWFRFQQDNRELIGHDGAEEGANTYMGFDPIKKVGFVLLTNISGDAYDESAAVRIQNELLHYGDRIIEAR